MKPTKRHGLWMGLAAYVILTAIGCPTPGGDTTGNQNAGLPDNVNGDGAPAANDNDNEAQSGNLNADTNENGGTDANGNGNDNESQQLTLTVEVETAGAGTVSSDPPGGMYEAGTVVELTAEANPTFSFLGFGGDAESTETVVSITMDADKSITATFAGNLFVSNFVDDTVVEFDAASGDLIGPFVSAGSGGLQGPTDLIFAPGGNLLVASADSVLEYDGASGDSVGVFVEPESGNLDLPSSLAFHPTTGDLLVASTDAVLAYDGSTGEFLSEFISPGTGGFSGARHFAFGPNDNLFMLATISNGQDTTESILEYDGQSGAFVGEFAGMLAGGASSAIEIVFGPDGNLYSADSGAVLHYDGTTGQSLGEFIVLDEADFVTAIAFGPADDLFVLVSVETEEEGQTVTQQSIRRYDGSTGELAGTFAGPTDQLGFIGYLTFKPLP